MDLIKTDLITQDNLKKEVSVFYISNNGKHQHNSRYMIPKWKLLFQQQFDLFISSKIVNLNSYEEPNTITKIKNIIRKLILLKIIPERYTPVTLNITTNNALDFYQKKVCYKSKDKSGGRGRLGKSNWLSYDLEEGVEFHQLKIPLAILSILEQTDFSRPEIYIRTFLKEELAEIPDEDKRLFSLPDYICLYNTDVNTIEALKIMLRELASQTEGITFEESVDNLLKFSKQFISQTNTNN